MNFTTDIAPLIGLTAQGLSTAIQMYATFKKDNIELFFKDLNKETKDLKKIGKDKKLEKMFYAILDKVATEDNEEKIRLWKNAVVHLATDFSDVDFKDTYTKTLDSLSVLDLTVLYIIYTYNFTSDDIEKEVGDICRDKKIDPDLFQPAVKRLATNGLITEMQSVGGMLVAYGSVDPLAPLHYVKNKFGEKFIRFISDDENLRSVGE